MLEVPLHPEEEGEAFLAITDSIFFTVSTKTFTLLISSLLARSITPLSSIKIILLTVLCPYFMGNVVLSLQSNTVKEDGVILALRWLTHEDCCEFEASLSYSIKTCFKRKKKRRKRSHSCDSICLSQELEAERL